MNTASIEGYASLFGVRDMAGDVVAAGAFARTLRAKRASAVKLLYQHDAAEPIGLLSQAREDPIGLFIAGELNLETQRGEEAYALLVARRADRAIDRLQCRQRRERRCGAAASSPRSIFGRSRLSRFRCCRALQPGRPRIRRKRASFER